MPTEPLADFLAELLDEQQRLQTPVAQFARGHDRVRSAFSPSLIPLSAPQAGEQYAFQVDLDACTGCKACVAACHSLNGLDDTESWRDVGLLLSRPADSSRTSFDLRHSFSHEGFAQTVTTACHHCADPGCLNGCPVRAYEKDPITGIVRHLDDQCIGCSYCILKCPYDVPKYNDRLGIVRKCDMCHGRLSAGEAPACVQACPTHAIRIVTVSLTDNRQADTSTFLPGAPDPKWTQPTTRYLSRNPLPVTVEAADAGALHVQPTHWPLVVMLVGTQASVGALAAGSVPVALALAIAGLAASVLHLGQPLRAWRAFLGLRRSWLSREIVVFGLYPPLLIASLLPWIATAASTAALVAGGAGVLCSIMIYVDTPRREWRLSRTALRFGATSLLAGLSTAFAASEGRSQALALALAALASGKLFLEFLDSRGDRQRRLYTGPLRRIHVSRILFGVLGGLFLPASALLDPASAAGCSLLAFVVVLIAEGAERVLFFRAVDPSKMPGVPVS